VARASRPWGCGYSRLCEGGTPSPLKGEAEAMPYLAFSRLQMRTLSDDELRRIAEEACQAPTSIRAELLTDPSCGMPLRVYLALTEGRAGRDLAAEDRFYNRYFWFRRFANAYRAKFGEDAGIEQQSAQILDDPGCDIDWRQIEQLELMAAETMT
jgi:hypothetical protein